MESVSVAASFKDAPSEFIDNLNLSFLNNIINIVVVEGMGADCLSEIVYIFKVFRVENCSSLCNEVLFKEYVVDFVHTLVCKGNSLRLFIKLVVAFKSFPLFWSHVNFIRVVVCFWILFNFLELTYIFVNFVKFEGVVFCLS